MEIYITLLADKEINGLTYLAGSHIKVDYDYGLSLINASPPEAVEYSSVTVDIEEHEIIIPEQYWKRTGTLLEPLTEGDDIKTTDGIIESEIPVSGFSRMWGDYIVSQDTLGNKTDINSSKIEILLISGNRTYLYAGGILKESANSYIQDESRYTRNANPTSSTILNIRQLSYDISGATGVPFQEYLTVDENWTSTSKPVSWKINTAKSGNTIAVQRLKITKDAEFRIGGTSNYSQFNEDGKFRQEGTATTWEDLQVSGSSITRAGANDPTVRIFVGNTVIYGFSASTMNEVFFSVQLTHKWKEGSTIEPHIHWSPLTSPVSSQNVVWKFEYTWANATVAFPAVATLTATAATGTFGNKHLVNTFGTIDGAGKTISSIMMCRLYRDAANAADTYTGEAGLLSFDIHIEQDTLGSDTEYGK